MFYLKIKKASVLVMVGLSVGAYAQSNKVVSAWKYLKDYTDYKEATSLPKAKEAIDLAAEHPDTKGEAKTWAYRGKIYQAIFEYNLKVEIDKHKELGDPLKQQDAAYQVISISELEEASKAYQKLKELDVKKNYTEECRKLAEVSRHYENIGISTYNAKKFEVAGPAFEKASETNSSLGYTDTLNLNYSAIAFEKGKAYDKAKTNYEKLINLKFRKAVPYNYIADIDLLQKDTLAYINIVKKGRETYPGDYNLIVKETNYYLWANKTEEALANLKLAIDKNPKEPTLYKQMGYIYDCLANPKDGKGGEADKPTNYNELSNLAEVNYIKAIDLQPKEYETLYNLGIFYNNKGVYISKQSDKITDIKKFEAETKKAEAEFKKAQEYLEKALDVNKKDFQLLTALKLIYARTQQTDKLNQINQMIKGQ